MTSLQRRARVFACMLAALAGFVDAIGFILSGGFFVSFMSGNSTRLGVGLAEAFNSAAIAFGIILAFVAGVVGGGLACHFAGSRRPQVVLLSIAILLASAAALTVAGQQAVAIALVAFAMGAENNVFEKEGEIQVGVTYMTGSLVKLGNGLAAALLGRRNGGWANYLMLWAGFVFGAVGGAILYGSAGAQSLRAASGIALLLALSSRSFLPVAISR